MKHFKFAAVMMAAAVMTATPAAAYLGQFTSYAKDKEDYDYSIDGASWEITADGKVFAVWDKPQDSSTATIKIMVDGDKKGSLIQVSSSAGRRDLTAAIKSINKEGFYTFRITAGKKNYDEDEKSYSESDDLDVDKEFLENLGKGTASGNTSNQANGATPGTVPGATQQTPANAATNSNNAVNEGTWYDWRDAGFGWAYMLDGNFVKNAWITWRGHMYHMNAAGAMDANTWVEDNLGRHFVNANGELTM